MTIELSLRRRAAQSRCLSILWLGLAVVILIGTYISIPAIAGKTLAVVNANLKVNGEGITSPIEDPAFYCATGMLIFGLAAVSFACILLGRGAMYELESAARLSGLADTLCVVDGNWDNLEKAAALLVPRGRYFTVPGILSKKDYAPFVEVLKLMRGGA